jgi:hypothetical protein
MAIWFIGQFHIVGRDDAGALRADRLQLAGVSRSRFHPSAPMTAFELV